MVWDILDGIGEQEITKTQRQDLQDVIKEFIDKNNLD